MSLANLHDADCLITGVKASANDKMRQLFSRATQAYPLANAVCPKPDPALGILTLVVQYPGSHSGGIELPTDTGVCGLRMYTFLNLSNDLCKVILLFMIGSRDFAGFSSSA